MASLYLLFLGEGGMPEGPWCGQHRGLCWECSKEDFDSQQKFKSQCKRRWEKLRADYTETKRFARSMKWHQLEERLLKVFRSQS